MILMPEPQPLPTQEQYASITRAIDDEYFKDRTTAEAKLIHFGRSTNDMRIFSRKALSVFGVIDPMDRSTNDLADQERVASRAMYLGALAGVLISQQADGSSMMPAKLMDMLRFNGEKENVDVFEDRYASAEAIREFGTIGYVSLSEEVRDRIEGWSEVVVPDVRSQSHFPIGTGLVVSTSHKVHELHIKSHDMQQMELLASSFHDFDLDASLEKILRGE